ncbi:LuxR C-terminal-related transcriptional regulator [Pararhizobium sp. IMCC21322]|uniref:helix-turn-helix transcriptional regulator n=1 Tax=Pararhizobium sp. IMCC21322 TaxID=3067903 RepID=UPI00274124FC|nr:LuxR C-terminal-related transcriptional regulator [Pararhizobium sp. IMCC21322]
MKLEKAISDIERCSSQDQLVSVLNTIVNDFGFAAFCFLDGGMPGEIDPFYVGTTGSGWEIDYASNDFILIDECLKTARRTNVPFLWASVPLPQRTGKRKPGAHRLMEAAMDYGFQEGLVIPFHFVDDIGRMRSCVCTLFWHEKPARLYQHIEDMRHFLHVILIYWMQELMRIRETGKSNGDVIPFSRREQAFQTTRLTDREREVLSWASRGKTAAETARILSISTETIDTHIKNAMEKLQAGNKTHAVARSIFLGLIDV